MPKNAVVILAQGFEETEAVAIIDVLRRAGIETTVAGLGDTKVTGSHRITLMADKTMSDISGEFDAVVLPGGMPGSTNLAASAQVVSLLKSMQAKNKIIAAICAAPAVVLAPNGILKNKTATCFPGMENQFPPGITFSAEDVVRSGNVITSRAAGTALKFSLAVVEALADSATADKVRKAMMIS